MSGTGTMLDNVRYRSRTSVADNPLHCTDGHDLFVSPHDATHHFVWGFTPGNRTLWQDIIRHLDTSEMELIGSLQFDGCEDARLDELACQTADAMKVASAELVASIEAQNLSPVVSLSGGMDSRIALAALCAIGHKPTCITFDNASYRHEIPYASAVAACAGCKHVVIDVPDAVDLTRADMMRVVRACGGLNTVNQAFGLKFADAVKNQIGNAALITGEGGDKSLWVEGAHPSVFNTGDLVNYLIATRAQTPIGLASRLARSRANQWFAADLWKILDAYPERTMYGKHRRWQVLERGLKWCVVGIQRDRSVLPQYTPFWSAEIQRLCSMVPRHMMEHRRFQTAVLLRLNRQLANIPAAPIPGLRGTLVRTSGVVPWSVLLAGGKIKPWLDGWPSRRIVEMLRASPALQWLGWDKLARTAHRWPAATVWQALTIALTREDIHERNRQ